jgi:NTP pyrophosphatase (non-canonical NTP hydrolase)
MNQPVNQALASTFEQLSQERNAAILSDIPEENRQRIAEHSFSGMVRELAKPGQAMLDTLKFTGFLQLLTLCTAIVNKGNQLDAAKKVIVYNKPPVDGADPESFKLPSSQGLGEAFEGLTPEKMHMLHMAVGLAGEAAEMLEQVVSHVLGAELDGENVREEAGDATFYIVGLLNGIQTSLGEAQLANKVKLLGKRYKNGYSDEAAQARADKSEGQ